MHQIGHYVFVKDGTFKGEIDKIINVEYLDIVYIYYIQSSDSRLLYSIAFYFRCVKVGYKLGDNETITRNRALAIRAFTDFDRPITLE